MSEVAPPEHPMYNWSDPKRVGPGAWYLFMLMSCQSKSKNERLWVCTQIRLFCDFFKCGECNGHCHNYITAHPPEDAIETEYGLFDWVVVFMNAVNTRLGKPTYDRDILFQTFTIQEFKFCDKDCGAAKHSKKEAYLRKQQETMQAKKTDAYTSVVTQTKNTQGTKVSGFFLKRH